VEAVIRLRESQFEKLRNNALRLHKIEQKLLGNMSTTTTKKQELIKNTERLEQLQLLIHKTQAKQLSGSIKQKQKTLNKNTNKIVKNMNTIRSYRTNKGKNNMKKNMVTTRPNSNMFARLRDFLSR
jgi:hypothetical protein